MRGLVFATLGAAAAWRVPTGMAGLDITAIDATGESIRTADGTVDAIWTESTLELEWVGLSTDSTIELELLVTDPETGVSGVVATSTETVDSTNGVRSVPMPDGDVLETDVFDASSVAADVPGETAYTEMIFTVEVRVERSDGPTLSDDASDTTTIAVEHLDRPRVNSLTLTDDSNPSWTRTTVDWVVSDDVDLARVTSELRFDDEETIRDSETSQVSGTDASGTHSLEVEAIPADDYTVALTVTNAYDLTATASRSSSGAGDLDPPALDTLTAVVTETQTRAQTTEPTAAEVTYAFEDDEVGSIDIEVTVSNATATETAVGESDSVELSVEPEGPPSEIATVTVEHPDGTIYSEDITPDSGEVNLL